jgi:NADH-quinone oxidoreductase subunit K
MFPMLTITHFLITSTLLLAAGLLTMVLKRNAIGLLMGIELVLNAAALNLVAFNAFLPPSSTSPRLDGQIFTLFLIVIAAAEAAVALAIFLNFYNNHATIDVDQATTLKG